MRRGPVSKVVTYCVCQHHMPTPAVALVKWTGTDRQAFLNVCDRHYADTKRVKEWSLVIAYGGQAERDIEGAGQNS